MATSLTLENIERENGTAVSVRKGSNAWHVLTATPVMLGSYDMGALCGRTVGNSRDVETSTNPTGEKFCKSCIRIHRELLNAAAEVRENSAPETAGQLVAFRIEGEPVTGPSEDERAELVKRERERRAAGACPGTGLPPVPGSRVQRDDVTASVPDTFTGKHSGKCPESTCGRIIAVSREGVMRRHKRAEVREVSAPVVREDSDKIWGLTWEELRARNAAHYAVNPVSAEVAALPDPYVKRSAWGGTNGAGDTDYRGCAGKGPVEIVNPERTHGKCPECRAYIPLADTVDDEDFRIGSHYEYGVNPPANVHMSSRSIETVEHGSIPGDPATADKRRAAESRCKRSGKILAGAEGGTVPCPECARPVELIKKISQTKKGTKIKWQVPNHVDPRDTFRGHGSDAGYVKGERKVTPRGTGADAGKGQRDHGSIDGAANTGRQNMPPVRPGGWVGKAGTMSLPATVRPGVDPEVSGKPCPICKELPEIAHAGMTKNQRRNHSRRLAAWHRIEDAKREAKRAADIEAGRILPAAVRRELRRAASIGSFAEGTQAATGEIAHGGTRPAVAPKLTPRGKTRAGK